MYQSHWGLRDSPFHGSLVMQLINQSPTHEEALARLHFLVDNHRRLGLMMGPSGSGKSLVLDVFAEQIERAGMPVAKISLLGLERTEMLWLLAAGFKLNPDPSASVADLWRVIVDRLAEFHYQRLSVVILLDDAYTANPEALAQVTRLVRYDGFSDARLTLVMAGQREKIDRLGEDLLELADLRIELEPWDSSDTANFLKNSLAEAGRKKPVFSESAIARLHELTQGIPRRVSQLADLSLMAGAGQNLQKIDAEIIETVYHELGVVEVR